MKPEESIKIKEKLDDVLLAVEEYGKQSEQFSKARNDLFSVLGVMNNTNSSLGQLLTACDQYLKKASEVIDGEYFVKIQGVINEINTTASNLEKCNEKTSEESVKLIDESRKQLTELADTLSKKIQASIEKVRGTADDLQKYSEQASENAKQLIQSSSNEILLLVEKLKSTCDSLLNESEQLKKNDGKIIETQGKIAEKIENTKASITDEIEKNNEICKSILSELTIIENNSADNKTAIIDAINESVNNGVSDLKSFEEGCIGTLKSEIENIDVKYSKKLKLMFIVGGALMVAILILQIINLII